MGIEAEKAKKKKQYVPQGLGADLHRGLGDQIRNVEALPIGFTKMRCVAQKDLTRRRYRGLIDLTPQR